MGIPPVRLASQPTLSQNHTLDLHNPPHPTGLPAFSLTNSLPMLLTPAAQGGLESSPYQTDSEKDTRPQSGSSLIFHATLQSVRSDSVHNRSFGIVLALSPG
ncbi:hypothetical protein [Pasteuria penetrans]|uniref:hypothetical protein n=1 Tax=Pasteuria penetrans TaxID=86005 RepID=UPI0011ED509A|nr:hypothetical protein [Pasteuria penetrans]